MSSKASATIWTWNDGIFIPLRNNTNAGVAKPSDKPKTPGNYLRTPVLKNRESQKTEKEPSVTIQFSNDEKQRIEETKEIEELVEVAGTIILRKLAEQKGESDAQSAP